MVTYRTKQINTNMFIDHAHHIAKELGCPEDKLDVVWHEMSTWSPALTERGFVRHVKDAMVNLDLPVNYDKLLDIIEVSH